jgi:peptide/nickel transport system substrate-binding protein
MEQKDHFRTRLIFAAWLNIICLMVLVIAYNPIPAIAADYLKVAILKEPKNLNPFTTSDAWTKKVIRLIYQPLYLVDPDTQTLTPWLAEDQPVYDSDKKTVTFHLRKMKWDDGSDFTAEDVVFTGGIFKKFQIPRYYAYWEFVKEIVALDNRTVRITLDRPMAVFPRRTLSTWIVQKKKWQPLIERAEKHLKPSTERTTISDEDMSEALKIIQTHKVSKPTGLGPFKFVASKKGKYILLLKNKYFFGKGLTISDHRLGPYIDGVMFKIFGSLATATLALEEGQIDFLWKGISQAFVNDLVPNPKVNVPMTLDLGYRYLGFNLREPPMSDHVFRQAVAYLINKNFIVNRVLHDHGQRLDTFVPPSNTYYYDSHTPTYGQGMNRQVRTLKAYDILSAAGYGWDTPPLDEKGSMQKGKGFKGPDGKAVPPVTLITPTAHYDTEAAATGKVIVEWLDEFGIPVSRKTMAFNSLLSQVKLKRDFDMFILGWRGLSLDPDYLRRFFHSDYDLPNQWNYTGYDNAEFNQLSNLQAETVDVAKRRQIVLRLQNILAEDLPIIPLYIPHLMEGVRNDRFAGWVKQAGGVGNIWTFCMLRPVQK